MPDQVTASVGSGDVSCSDLASQIRAGTVDIPALVEAHLERADEAMNSSAAFVTICRAEARRAAVTAQETLERGEPTGPLHGVPISVKDILATSGVRTTAGSRLLRDHVPGATATAVSRLLGAGAILIGKTNCPEFAFGITTTSPAGSTPGPFSPSVARRLKRGRGIRRGRRRVCARSGYGLRRLVALAGAMHGHSRARPTPGRVPTSGQLPGIGGRWHGMRLHRSTPDRSWGASLSSVRSRAASMTLN